MNISIPRKATKYVPLFSRFFTPFVHFLFARAIRRERATIRCFDIREADGEKRIILFFTGRTFAAFVPEYFPFRCIRWRAVSMKETCFSVYYEQVEKLWRNGTRCAVKSGSRVVERQGSGKKTRKRDKKIAERKKDGGKEISWFHGRIQCVVCISPVTLAISADRKPSWFVMLRKIEIFRFFKTVANSGFDKFLAAFTSRF